MSRSLDLEEALEALDNGGVVALPTDTVYGLAASLEHGDAVEAIYELKHRPSSLALPVLVNGVAQIEGLGATWTPRASALSDAFWPGALTIVVTVPTPLSSRLGSTNDTVGFRLPDSPLLRELLSRSGPLAVTSANVHGATPCTSAAEVLEAFAGRPELAGVLDGGVCSGSASTVVDVSGVNWLTLRGGAIDQAALDVVLGESRER